jgi:hypothetical protein
MNHLYEFCTSESQKVKLEAYIRLKTFRNVSAELGISHQNISRTLRVLKKRAAASGIAPEADMSHPAAEGFNIKGVSTYYDQDGQVRGQWVKTQNGGYSAEQIAEAFNEFLGDFKCLPTEQPNIVDEDILAVYPMGDPHLGMYAWAEEAGEDFDLKIACEDLRKATNALVDRSPAAETAVILNLGDFFHSDNQSNRTARSGNSLDVDGRWAKVLKTGIDLMIELTISALRKHKKVIVKNIIGNHDDHSSIFLGLAMDKYFHDEPRVTIDYSSSKFWFYKFGKVLIGSTHGDAAKPDKLPQIMAADRAQDWGDTEYRYWYTGHIHSRNSIEFVGCTWESFRNLAPNDSWHAGMGYRSGKDMNCIILHKEFGEIGRNTASLKMVRA